jgi:hypothetical protein
MRNIIRTDKNPVLYLSSIFLLNISYLQKEN